MDIFNIPGGDLSLQMLYYIFNPLMIAMLGASDPTVTSASANAFAAGFQVFNSGVLFLASVYVILHSLSAIARTAHEGEIMGKSWSTLWVPLRIGVGFSVLLPLSTGYSLIQVFVMWFTLQGVGMADSIYTAMLKNMVPPQDINLVMKADDIYPMVKNLFMASSCVHHAQNGHEAKQILNEDLAGKGPVVNFKYTHELYKALEFRTVNRVTRQEEITKGVVYQFGDAAEEGEKSYYGKDVCGSMIINYQDLTESASALFSNDTASDIQDTAIIEFNKIYSEAVNKMVEDTYIFAHEIANIKNSEQRAAEHSLRLITIASEFNGAISTWVDKYQGDALQTELWSAFLTDQLLDGWISGGSVYVELSKLNANFGQIVDSRPTVGSAYSAPLSGVDKAPWLGLGNPETPEKFIAMRSYIDPKMAVTSSTISIWEKYASNNPALTAGLKADFIIYPSANTELLSKVSAASDDGYMDKAFSKMNAVMDGLGAKVQANSDHSARSGFLDGSRSPIVVAQEYGTSMIHYAYIMLGSLVAIAVLTGGVPFAGGILAAVMTVIMPIVGILTVGLLFFGVVLSVYIPMVPFITWTGGVVTWLVMVLEAMIIAPIWAISFLSPEGEGFTGQKAEQGWLLILSLFLRPTLMVFGLFSAMAVSFVLFAYLNAAFEAVFINSQSGTTYGLMSSLGYWVIYAIVCTATLSTIYSLIHIVPDKVLRWIGGGQESLGDMGTEQASRAAFGAVISSGNSATQAGVGAIGADKKKAAIPDPETDTADTPESEPQTESEPKTEKNEPKSEEESPETPKS